MCGAAVLNCAQQWWPTVKTTKAVTEGDKMQHNHKCQREHNSAVSHTKSMSNTSSFSAIRQKL